MKYYTILARWYSGRGMREECLGVFLSKKSALKEAEATTRRICEELSGQFEELDAVPSIGEYSEAVVQFAVCVGATNTFYATVVEMSLRDSPLVILAEQAE